MHTGTRVTPGAGRDRVLIAAMMAVRLGFVAAIALGVGRMAGVVDFRALGGVHILAGGVALLGVLVAGIRALALGRGAALLMIGLLGGVAGAAVALADLGGVFHLALMVTAVGLAEMNAAKLRKA